MGYSATYNTTIKAPVAKVFEYTADVARHGEWGSEPDHMKVAAEQAGSPAVGKRYKAEGMLNGKLNQSVVTITDYEPTKRFAIDAKDANSIFHHEFIFTPDGGGTQVERRVTMTKGPFYFPLVLAIFKSTVVKNYDGAMMNLKARLEAGA